MNNLMKVFSFTKNETKVILFIIAVLTAGFSIKYYKHITGNESAPYDFSASDSEFRQKSALKHSNNQSRKEEELSDSLYSSEDSLTSKLKSLKDAGPDKFSGEVININTATKLDFIDLPGIGESIAEKIISYRESKKRFKNTQELMNVSGIGKKKYDKIKNYIRAE